MASVGSVDPRGREWKCKCGCKTPWRYTNWDNPALNAGHGPMCDRDSCYRNMELASPVVETKSYLPSETAARKAIPMASGVLDYFPAALAAVAELSKKGNDKHNPGQPLHWARGKSMDHADCILRHIVDRGTVDPEDGISHSVKVAWRALALLQEELEAQGAPMSRGSKVAK